MGETAINTWYCTVPVATVWTSPESVRDLDMAGVSNPVRLMEWLEKLTYEPRLDLCDGNRIQTQLLYGEPVIVEETKGEWAKVIAVWQPSKKDERGYPGWVPLVQLKKAEPIRAKGFAKVTVGKAQLWNLDGSPSLVIPFNSILPYIEKLGSSLLVQTPSGEALLKIQDVELAPSIHQFKKASAEIAMEKGLKFLELPYFWGGMSSYGFDCSGLTYNLLKACGHTIPRDAGDQAKGGVEVPFDDEASWRRGDLLFFANDSGKGNVRHVGFYFGDGIMLHSPSTGKSVELMRIKGTKLEEELCEVRRYGTTGEDAG